MALTLGVVTDLHFGPDARHEGKLRKMSHEAGALTRAFVRRMKDEVHPDAIVNLGDDVEDESREKDLARYAECQAILREAGVPVLNVAGNHDVVNMNRHDLVAMWQHDGPLYYSTDRGGWHLVVLHTIEDQDGVIRIPAPQLEWLAADLAAGSLPTLVLMHHSLSEQDVGDSRWFAGRPEAALVHDRADIRALLAKSGRVRAVLNGHVHRNHLDVVAGIPYVTLQSLIENLDEDAPGRAAAAHAVVHLTATRITVRVAGNDPARYQFEL